METKNGRSARSRNCHRAAIIAFANWCSDPSIGRLSSNPFKGVPKADEKADNKDGEVPPEDAVVGGSTD